MSFTNSTTTDSKSITRDAYDTLDTKTATGRHISPKSKSSKFSMPALDFSKHHDQDSIIRSITTMIVLPVMALIVAFAHPEALNTVTIGMFIVGEILMAAIS